MAHKGKKKDYDNNMTGVLFKNEKRRPGDDGEDSKDPHMTGSIEVDGKEYWLSAWSNDHDEKGKYLKLRLKEKDEEKKGGGFEQKKAPAKAPAKPAKGAEFDDDLPF